ncbi:cytochrome P450 1B1 [Trichomycterus rosablanca]|uniref:cytochrome P450 1B1 n=1 Tax=Trichomycterus rosablanca TaxID=2290929 RepID=UPI002F35321A
MELLGVITDFLQLSRWSVSLVCLAVYLSIHLLFGCVRHWRYRTIPGPFPWPIVGNAPQIGSNPHLYFSRLARQYGNVFQIKLGNRAVVVLNGDAILQALVKKGVDFAGRPDFASFSYVSGGRSMAFGNYNEWWKVHRRVAQATVRKFTTGNGNTKRAFEDHVVSEVRELLTLFVDKTRKHGYFQPNYYLVVSTANIISAVCFGKRYSYDDSEFQQLVGRNDKFSKTVGAGSIVDVMPWLQYFPNPIKTLFGQFKELNAEFYDFIVTKVVEHRKTIETSVVRDITDALIVTLDRGMNGPSGVHLDGKYVPPTIGDIFGASQDTISTVLQWIVLVLVRYPDIQKKLQEEVDKVVDRSRLPSIDDQPNLPYVMAFIYEVMRFTSFIPLTIPHSTTTDTSVSGYPLPKGTVVFVNQWSLNHDPVKWDQPDVFNPLRFLDENGALNKDMASNVLIFSTGKRRCIGEQLSKMQLFLFTVLLAQQCNFTVKERPTLEYTYGLTMKPNPFYVAVTLRDNINLGEKLV